VGLHDGGGGAVSAGDAVSGADLWRAAPCWRAVAGCSGGASWRRAPDVTLGGGILCGSFKKKRVNEREMLVQIRFLHFMMWPSVDKEITYIFFR
jgi:hypothetical protein